MSRHFALNSELTGAIAKIHAKNQLSAPCSFFNQFVTDIYIYVYTICINRVLLVRIYIIYTYIYICNELIEETVMPRKLIFGMRESFGYSSSKFRAQTKMLTHHGIMTSLSHF